jgi:hypothetical protein
MIFSTIYAVFVAKSDMVFPVASIISRNCCFDWNNSFAFVTKFGGRFVMYTNLEMVFQFGSR